MSGPSIVVMAAAAALSVLTPLTPDGWGDLKIGMHEADAARLLHVAVPPDDEVNGRDCREIPAPDVDPGLVVMTQGGRVSRISLFEQSRLKTDRGFGLGSREADIRRAYGPVLKVEPHYYDAAPAHYLTAWSTRAKRGVRYETDDHGVVNAIHVGDETIRLVEGCL